MTKKYGIMNKPFQIWNIKRYFRMLGIEGFDFSSLIDSQLHYPENQNEISKSHHD